MHKTFSFALAAATASCFVFEHPSAKARGPLTILSNPGSLQTCFGHVARCIVPVYVHPLSGGGCSTWIDAGKIVVPQPTTVPGGTFQPKHVKVVWVIKKGEPSVKIGQYVFEKNLGVAPATIAAPTDTSDQFTSEGLDGPDLEDGDRDDPMDNASINRRFRWVSTHKVTGVDGHFDLNIYRTSRVGTTTVTKRCDSVDPLISNT